MTNVSMDNAAEKFDVAESSSRRDSTTTYPLLRSSHPGVEPALLAHAR